MDSGAQIMTLRFNTKINYKTLTRRQNKSTKMVKSVY